jgi:MFS family permease
MTVRRAQPAAPRSLLGYGAGAAAPLLFGAILDWYGVGAAGAWGWAFVSLGIAGVGAVVSVVLLHATPEADILKRRAIRRPFTSSASVR